MHCHAPALRHVAMSAVGEGWTCKVEGQKELTHASGDYLHATAPPPEGLALMLFERRLCTPEPLPLAELDNWLHAYQRDPAAPVDLRRKKPDSHLWWEVTTLQRSVESLADDEVDSLRYLAPGAGAAQNQGGDQARVWVIATILAQANCSAAEQLPQAFWGSIEAKDPNTVLVYAQSFVMACQELGIGACVTVTSLSSAGAVLGEVQLHTDVPVPSPTTARRRLHLHPHMLPT
ncbi:hypothetical protein ABPG75_004510 [Micractinium tetrahymenae]